MIAPNPNLLCKQAEPYYYDFLCDESRGLIPESIVNHIEQCQQCREQINKLKAALSQADDLESEQGRITFAVTTMLKLHFTYAGKPVTCNTVKPFLPCLLDPALEIRIPTPIITHLHNCQQCSEDLDLIRCLNLNRKQLCRLSQLFVEKHGKYNVSCWQAHAAVVVLLSMDFRETKEEVLKHICLCRYCRKLLYQYREAFRKDCLRKEREEKFPCEEVSATDIFDYVVPYGIDPANDQYAKFRKSFTSHAATCPNCLAKMQELHKTIYNNIAERAESDVVTIYHVDESAKAEAHSESDDIYAGFPIRVETASREDEVNAGRSASTIAFGAALKQKVSARNVKSLVKIAAVAAAILIGVSILLKTPTAGAVTIDKIYRVLVKVKNVHISKFDDKQELIQERWVSRTLNIYMIKTMTKTGEELVLSDIPNRVRKSKKLDTAVTKTERLTDDDVADIETKMAGSLGLMPLSGISERLEDAEWSPVADDGLEGVSEGIEVYDLIWTEKTRGGSALFRKWRVFANAETNRPEKVEWYKKLDADDEFVLETIMVVGYLRNSEIRTVIKNFGF